MQREIANSDVHPTCSLLLCASDLAGEASYLSAMIQHMERHCRPTYGCGISLPCLEWQADHVARAALYTCERACEGGVR